MKNFLLLTILLSGTYLAFGQRSATILDHKDRIRISRLDVLNSPARETNLSITPDGKYLYFMSLRGGQPWSRMYMTFRGDSVYDGDIWYAQKVGGEWQRPRCLPYSINTSQGEDEPNISADGRKVYFQSWNYIWPETGGPYYEVTRDGKSWTSQKGLGGGITEFFHNLSATDGMSISPNGKRFVVAAGPDYDDDMDLFMSRKSRYGWTYCRRLPISTRGNDRSIFIAADGKTIYFASDGYGGYGGLDIFKTTMINDSTFGEVINIGKPFNTPNDDYGFILTGDGNEAYFIRDGDIYFADLKEADPKIKPSTPEITLKLAGSVRDKNNWEGIKAEILLLDAYTKQVIRRIETDNRGRYSIPLSNRKRLYEQIVSAEGYPQSKKRISVEKQYTDKTISSNFLLEPEDEPEPLIAQNPNPEPTIPPKPQPEEKEPAKPSLNPLDNRNRPNDGTVGQSTVDQPAPVKVAPPPDPYSFDGIAENNLILLLDVSASMKKPEKLPLLKESLTRLLDHMRPEDRISVIAYAGDVDVVLEGMSAANKYEILNAIENLRSAGGTKSKEAIRRAYRLADDNYISGGNNRIIFATDGFFDVSDLYSIVERNAENSSVHLTVFSFGKLSEDKIEELEALARIGHGNFANVNRDNVDRALLTEAKAVRK
ncbi:MAG: VWA domain-containing protein [Bacteroidota bacterium]